MIREVQIIGLEQLRADLRRIDPELAKELYRVFKDAADPIVRETKREVPVRSGRLAKAVRARATRKEGRVQMGTPKRVAYAGWIEFGGRRRGPGSRVARRPFVREGRYLYPSFYDNDRVRREVHRVADEGMERVIRKAGLR